MGYSTSRVSGSGTAVVDILGPDVNRTRVTLRNLGPAAVFLGGRDLNAPPSGAWRLLPGDTAVVTDPAPLYGNTYPSNTYTLEVLAEARS